MTSLDWGLGLEFGLGSQVQNNRCGIATSGYPLPPCKIRAVPKPPPTSSFLLRERPPTPGSVTGRLPSVTGQRPSVTANCRRLEFRFHSSQGPGGPRYGSNGHGRNARCSWWFSVRDGPAQDGVHRPVLSDALRGLLRPNRQHPPPPPRACPTPGTRTSTKRSVRSTTNRSSPRSDSRGRSTAT